MESRKDSGTVAPLVRGTQSLVAQFHAVPFVEKFGRKLAHHRTWTVSYSLWSSWRSIQLTTFRTLWSALKSENNGILFSTGLSLNWKDIVGEGSSVVSLAHVSFALCAGNFDLGYFIKDNNPVLWCLRWAVGLKIALGGTLTTRTFWSCRGEHVLTWTWTWTLGTGIALFCSSCRWSNLIIVSIPHILLHRTVAPIILTKLTLRNIKNIKQTYDNSTIRRFRAYRLISPHRIYRQNLASWTFRITNEINWCGINCGTFWFYIRIC